MSHRQWTPFCKPNEWSVTVGVDLTTWTLGVQWIHVPYTHNANGVKMLTLYLPMLSLTYYRNTFPKGSCDAPQRHR